MKSKKIVIVLENGKDKIYRFDSKTEALEFYSRKRAEGYSHDELETDAFENILDMPADLAVEKAAQMEDV